MMKLRMGRRVSWASVLILLMSSASSLSAREFDFNRDVRPILSDLCFQCHGPDSSQRKADLRLDLQSGLLGTAKIPGVVIPGKADESELLSRLISDDPDLHMPPASSEKQITAVQIATIQQWINQGARWQKHWAFIPPVRPAIPAVKQPDWVQNPIDAFVLARLEQEELAPAPPADRATLIRRLSLDLTGLPPTIAEQDAFFHDHTSTAYQTLVARLLKSPHYGERMAMEWLDAARFADTSGYQTDGERHMWRWREWVIDAFNSNKPFDEFTIEQLAGDLLPQPTLNQKIATGFNRNHRSNSEGGIIFEEYLLEYAVDRVETTGTVWLGLTVGCARCHDHKYDPISQKDFYQLIAFFNNIPERGRAIKYGNAVPFVKAPTQEQQQKLSSMDHEIQQREQFLKAAEPELKQLQKAWEQQHSPADLKLSFPEKHLAYHIPFDGEVRLEVIGKQTKDFYAEKTNASSDLISEEQSIDAKLPEFKPGIAGQALSLNGRQQLATKQKPVLSDKDPFSLVFWVKPAQLSGTLLASLTPAQDESGFQIALDQGQLKINMGPRWLDDAIRLQSTRKLNLNSWSQIVLTYAGNSQAEDFQLYVNGTPWDLEVKLNILTGGFSFPSPLHFGAEHENDLFLGLLDDLKIYRTRQSQEWVTLNFVREPLERLLQIPAADRSAAERLKIQRSFLAFHSPEIYRTAFLDLQTLKEDRESYYRSLPTSMIMQDRKQPQPTFVLMRGEYDKPGAQVSANIPASLGTLSEQQPRNRLGLARWLVDPQNPLTARVIVNRFWQMYFGNGLVKTTEDFGSQGSWPTHPELLDWLALEFIHSGWDVKHLQKLIVTSATYQQSSHVTSEKLKADPENQLLAHASRLRLPAELIRDQALFTSGLLNAEIGGPSVKPYQPAGVWKEIASQLYQPDTGEDLYRRSMYTFWKRTVPPPAMATFDAPSRETCIVKRSRTNTPLQALALLNDVTYVEAARKLAERMLEYHEQSPAARIQYAMRLVLARDANERELPVLVNAMERSHSRFQKDTQAAQQLLSVGESQPNQQYDAAELAACTIVASLILNLDETINRE
ncbi:MAG: hypothetical protein CME33_11565 [Gimesia sp.]|nr:hypothetical protein [Gimesia sp.]